MTASIKTPSFALSAMKANCTTAKAVVDFLMYAGTDAPRETIQAALGDLHAILDDNESLLKHAFDYDPRSLGTSRLPKGSRKPLSPKDAMDILQVNMDLMEIEVGALLRQPWARDEEYKNIAERRDHVIKMMGFISRYYKAVISHRDPALWTPEVEKRFEKFLKIKP